MLLWLMVFAQLVVWGWFSWKGGQLPDKKFLIFTVGMLLGQFAAGIETYQTGAVRARVVQADFFIFTAFGGIQRFKQMRKKSRPLPRPRFSP